MNNTYHKEILKKILKFYQIVESSKLKLMETKRMKSKFKIQKRMKFLE